MGLLRDNTTKNTDTSYEKKIRRIKFRTEAGITPVIGHLKSNFRLDQNHFLGEKRPQINALPSATAWNMKKMMGILKANIYICFYSIQFLLCFKTNLCIELKIINS